MLSGRADKIFISFEESKDFYNKKLQTKIFTTGNPVRESILNMPDREAAYRRFDLDITKRTLLIFGGSLGASAINETVARSLDELEGLGLNIIWQTGNSFKLESVRENIRCYKFIEEMGYAYSASDLVVSR
jgi:UDP-N-acetylglucosamine--N-acetylmuramyl-(pentapeptide) pyrophosphoryl-undecaprenol N-acetylglucosamine transferase